MTTTPSRTKEIGVSLTQDAWRRLKKSWAAMTALWTLVAVVVLAFFTPLLPLQPPDRDLTRQMFAEPTLSPIWEDTFAFEAELVDQLDAEITEARSEFTAQREEFNQLRPPEASPEAIEEAARTVRRARANVDSLIQRPYADAGFPKLGPLARAMVRARYAVFGEWQLASVCGRDKLGRDLLSRIFWGARVSLIVGIVATLVSLVIGVSYGAISGYAGGWIDNLMMRIVDVLYSIPFVFLVIFIISVLSEDSVKEWLAGYGIDRITIFYFVVGAIYWLTMARVVRGQVVSLRNEQYVEAARSLGVSQGAIVFRHIVPNLLSIVLVYLTLTIPRVILFEAFLSFLGLGVEPPDVSWGLLANEGIQVITPVKTYWWLIVFPSLAIGSTLFALNFLGDGLRDAFDPRMKGR
ncbi:Oligopeptide transport system permease protein OppC [Botrimarina colliarenosi]|uniref:Oligopeptide transport system permease protein OppC n=1 Tax=Botrimarina colliarenosi TaxID=2528001 RepID=A0A5C6A7R9_9BACT|nr:ABC transporter permease [Botrimarina colliarenosi]TWT96052.1 Oligopeptide transport system permease protein OppC [Botrimarina colliarenosi]